jgi:uncharacterized membrane protein YfcA
MISAFGAAELFHRIIRIAEPLANAPDRVMTDLISSLLSWPVMWAASTFFLAGIVKGVTGMGLPTVAMGLLSLIMSPVTAAGLMIVPSFITNLWQLLAGPSFAALAKRLWLMLGGVALGTLAGAAILAGERTRWTGVALGIALTAYAGYTLMARQISVPPRAERWLSLLIGIATGIVTGGTGVFVIPAVPFLQALHLDKDDLIQALGLSFTVSTVTLALGLGLHGAFVGQNFVVSFVAVAPALLGMWVGRAIRKRVSPTTFRRWFLIFLMILGAELALRPLFG